MDDESRIREFMKPRCPVKVGDKFYKNYKVPNQLLIYKVTKIEEKEDEDGIFYAVTAVCENIQVGINTKVFSSRYLNSDEYTFLNRVSRANYSESEENDSGEY